MRVTIPISAGLSVFERIGGVIACTGRNFAQNRTRFHRVSALFSTNNNVLMYHPNREKQARRRRKSVFSSAEKPDPELDFPCIPAFILVIAPARPPHSHLFSSSSLQRVSLIPISFPCHRSSAAPSFGPDKLPFLIFRASIPVFFTGGLAFCTVRVYSYRTCCMGVSRFRLDTLNVNCIPRMIVGLVNHRSIQ